MFDPKKVKYLVVHCSATTPAMLIGAKEIDKMHRERIPPFNKIGYHFVIRRNNTSPAGGYLEYGRLLNEVGAHVEGHNSESIGIVLIGGIRIENDIQIPENNFLDIQFSILKDLLKALKAMFPKAEVLGHRDFAGVNKPCPCFDVRSWYEKTTNS